MSAREILDLLKTTASEASEDNVMRLAASLAYFTLFSLTPLLIVIIAIAGLVFGREAVQGHLTGQIEGLVGREGAELIQTMVAGASGQTSGIIATAVGLGTLLLGAAGVFGNLKDSLNVIWEVQPKANRGIMETIKERFLSFTMVLGTGFLLLVSLVLSAGLAALTAWFEQILPIPGISLHIVDFVVSFGVIALLFAMIFKILPDVEIAWRDAAIGAVVTALLFTIGRVAIGLYIGQSSPASTYGAAGSLVIVLLWIYYSALILFVGAEFTQVYANRHGSRVRPATDAVPLIEHTAAAQSLPDAEGTKGEKRTKGRRVASVHRRAKGNGDEDNGVTGERVAAMHGVTPQPNHPLAVSDRDLVSAMVVRTDATRPADRAPGRVHVREEHRAMPAMHAAQVGLAAIVVGVASFALSLLRQSKGQM